MEALEASVKEIHGHPLRPQEFVEPLFLGREDKKEIAEHLARSNWLGKVSEATEPGGRPCGRPCHVYRGRDGEAWLVRTGCGGRRRCGGHGRSWRRGRTRKRRVARVIERWREVRNWWEPESGTDRLFFRVLLAGTHGGVVADIALDRRYGWSLVRVLD